MERNQKITLAVLGLIVVLFVVALLVGLGGEGELGDASSLFASGKSKDTPDPPRKEACAAPPPATGWVGGLGRLLVKKVPLKARDTSAACRNGNGWNLAPGTTCRVEIPASAWAARRACLELTAGQGLQLGYTQAGVFPVVRSLGQGGELGLDIHARKEAELTLTCQGQAECRVVLR